MFGLNKSSFIRGMSHFKRNNKTNLGESTCLSSLVPWARGRKKVNMHTNNKKRNSGDPYE